MREEDFIRSLIRRLAHVEPVIPHPPVKVRKRIRAIPVALKTEPLDEGLVKTILARYKEP